MGQGNLKAYIKKENINIDDFIGAGSTHEVQSWSDSTARQALIFWAIVTENEELVKYLWRKSSDPIAWGLGRFSNIRF